MEIKRLKDYTKMSRSAFEWLRKEIEGKESINIGFATGNTPIGLYHCMVEAHLLEGFSYKHINAFHLDEYVGLNIDSDRSYRYYMHKRLFDHIDVQPNAIRLLNGTATDLEGECRKYENLIKESGGIDIQIVGLGENGHIAFNEPHTSFDSRTHVVSLEESTRMANARFFEFYEEIPKQAITMGLGTIMESKKILLLVSGSKKKEAFERFMSKDLAESFPASILHTHSDVTVLVDEESIQGGS